MKHSVGLEIYFNREIEYNIIFSLSKGDKNEK